MNNIDQRILSLLPLLKEKHRQSMGDIYINIGILRQNIYKIKSGEKHFTVKHIYNLRTHYNINFDWIAGISEQMYIKSYSDSI